MNRTRKRLDEIDQRLVALLRRDARRATASLGRDLNFSRTAVQARIARLERDGVILGSTTTLASDVVAGVMALVSLSISVRPCALWPEVERIYSIAGDRDAVLIVSAASPQALSQLADRLQTIEGIKNVETTVVLSHQTGSTHG